MALLLGKQVIAESDDDFVPIIGRQEGTNSDTIL